MNQVALHTVYGNPLNVVRLETQPPSKPLSNQVKVKILRSVIHPSDLNMIEGHYPHLPSLPAVLGKEGVGIVEEVGSEIRHLRPGDHVVSPFESDTAWTGWWRTEGIFEGNTLMAIPKDIPLDQAAMLCINPLTAWLLLRQCGELEPGDSIIQNAANSSVGRCVIQLAKILGHPTLNLIRQENLMPDLFDLGATEVLLDYEGLGKTLKNRLDKKNFCLGLNAVGGFSALNVASLLRNGSTLVTYGAMSKQSLSIPNSLMIYNDIRFIGMMRARWCSEAGRATVSSLMTRLISWVRSGQLVQAVDSVFEFSDLPKAIKRSMENSRQGKVVLRVE